MPKLIASVPCFPVADVGATIRWYEEHLGFKGDPFPQTEPYVFGILFRDHVEIMVQRLAGYEKPDLYQRRADGIWDAYLRMEGVREFYESVRERVEVIRPLQRMPYPQWEFEVKDLNGYVLVFSEEAHG
ncbi:MAG TPA: VOC family protein [Pyrinomonadaceae bacterium]|nr:VOC family protein [Pyrinomonadaceae bacterium]